MTKGEPHQHRLAHWITTPNHEAKVQIEKKQNHSTPSSSTADSNGTKVAQQYAAIFPARLALARWTHGGDIPHVHCFEHQLPMRAGWYGQAQRHFQAWLEAGGFHDPELDPADSVIADVQPAIDATGTPDSPDHGGTK